MHLSPRYTRFTPVPLALATAVTVALATGYTARAQAQSAPSAAAPVRIDIPAQALGQALNQLARQTNLQMSYPAALVAGKQAPAVSGPLSVPQALERLLAGSGLRAELDGTAVMVRPLPPPAASASPSALPTVTVSAGAVQESAWGPVHGYVAKRSATGTKTDTPILETPQSISVVGAEEIEVRKATNLTDALGYVAGISRSEGADRAGEYFVIRGFRAYAGVGSMYRDGTKYAIGGFDGQQEPYGLERIELLKGASSVLYGASAPGGILNTVSKRPSATPLRELNVEFGSFNRKQISADLGGALDAEGVWTYRLTALQRDSDAFTDHVRDDRRYLAPALKWQPNATTSLTLLGQYQRNETQYLAAFPGEGTVLPNPNGKLRRELFGGEPSFDKFDQRVRSIGYLFEHDFSDQAKLRHSLRRFDSEGAFNYTEMWKLAADQRHTLSRDSVKRDAWARATVADTSLQYRWGSGAVQHTSLVGFDVTRQKDSLEQYLASAPSLDLFKPSYGGSFGPFVPSGFYSPVAKTNLTGLYAQDQMKVADKWVLLLGGRYEHVRYDEVNFHTGEVAADNEKSQALTGRAGLVYLADNGIAPYLSFSQSFNPQPGIDRSGQRFKPLRGEQWELGLRYQPKGSDTLLTLAVYDLTRNNDLVTDPSNPLFKVQRGEVRSRGLEIEAKSRIGRNLNLIAAYAYTDARTVKSSPLTPEQQGVRTNGVPFNQLSIWGDYDFGSFGLPGLKAGLGIRHVGATRGGAMGTTVEVPAFVLIDAVVRYTTGPWSFTLNLSNLADKTYIASCTYGCFFGEPRKAIATVSYRW